MKKILSLLLVLVMALGLGSAFAEPALTKDIVVLYTNDVHCGIDAGIGYSGLAAYRNKLVEEGNHVTLVDVGDAIQGEPVGTISQGSYIIDIMNHLGYDIATIGNHEFDYGMDRFLELKEMAQFPYVAVNFMDLQTMQPILEPYRIFDYEGVKVAYLGIATPKTFTSSTPTYFQDEADNFIYSFSQGDNGQELYDAVQAAVEDARAAGAQYVVALAHLGIEAECAPWMSTDIITNTTGIDVVLDGHSHSVIPQELVKNKDGEDVILSQTGTKLQNVGVLRIGVDGVVSTSLLSWDAAANKTIDAVNELLEEPLQMVGVIMDVDGTPTADILRLDADTAKIVDDINAHLSDTLQQVVAQSEVDLIVYEPGTDPAVRLIRNAETNLGNLCADAYRMITGANIGLVNGGGIRVDIPAGEITYDEILKVHPYGNELCMVEATGQEVLDALEMGARVVPEENGGFLHVSGLTYEIHTYVPNSVKLSDEGLFQSVEGEYRVQNVMVDGQPLDLAATYTVASHNYLIKNAGDGMTMFQDNNLLLDSIMLDNQVLINYITQPETLGGVVGQEYAEIYGEGRIVAVPEKVAE